MEVEDIFGEFPVLETERLLLRKVTEEDAAAVFKYGANPNVTKYVTWDTHRTLADAKGFVGFALSRYESRQIAPWGIVLKETDEFIGTIDFVAWRVPHKTAEIGYVLAEEYWGKGIVTEAAAEVVRFGFVEMDLVRIEARCFPENIGSSRVMEKLGMQFEGVLRKSMYMKGEHQDLSVYSLLKEEWKMG